jgi:hypothetical protein
MPYRDRKALRDPIVVRFSRLMAGSGSFMGREDEKSCSSVSGVAPTTGKKRRDDRFHMFEEKSLNVPVSVHEPLLSPLTKERGTQSHLQLSAPLSMTAHISASDLFSSNTPLHQVIRQATML